MAGVAHALNGDESLFVWVDICAVRQWPGNTADLAFDSVVRDTHALLLVSPHLESIERMTTKDAFARKSIPEEAAKKCAFFRVWCLVRH